MINSSFWTRNSQRPISGELYGHYKLEDFLFETKYSILYSSTNTTNGEKKAIKFIKCIKGREEIVENEIEIMKRINHPNLLKLEYSHYFNPYQVIVTNYAPLQNLYIFTNKYYPKGMPLEVARIVLKQMVSAVYYLHELGIWHRDIKPQNFPNRNIFFFNILYNCCQ